MLYGKIYVDWDMGGQRILVFSALAASGIEARRAEAVEHIAISPEARAVLLARLDRSDTEFSRYSGEFEFFGDDETGERGAFRFMAKDEKNGIRSRVLREDERLTVMLAPSCRRAVLDYMIPCDNETLKELALSDRIDEATLWEAHFSALFSCGEEPACDAETIRRTPAAYLTEAQREAIRREFHARCEAADGDEGAIESIIDSLIPDYLKSGPELSAILGADRIFHGKLTFLEALSMIEEEFPLRRAGMHIYSPFVDATLDGYHFFSITLREDLEGGLVLTDNGSTYHCFEEIAEDEAEWVALCEQNGFSFVHYRILRPFTGMDDLYAYIDFLNLVADTYDPIDGEEE